MRSGTLRDPSHPKPSAGGARECSKKACPDVESPSAGRPVAVHGVTSAVALCPLDPRDYIDDSGSNGQKGLPDTTD